MQERDTGLMINLTEELQLSRKNAYRPQSAGCQDSIQSEHGKEVSVTRVAVRHEETETD